MCMKIGCPAISMKDGKAQIDFTQCLGCNVCSQLLGGGFQTENEEKKHEQSLEGLLN